MVDESALEIFVQSHATADLRIRMKRGLEGTGGNKLLCLGDWNEVKVDFALITVDVV